MDLHLGNLMQVFLYLAPCVFSITFFMLDNAAGVFLHIVQNR